MDYKVEAAAPPLGENLSRVCLLIKNNIVYKRRPDLEPAGLAIVVLDIKLGSTSFTLIGYYRQWSVPGLPHSNSPANQIIPFDKLLELGRKVSSKGNVIITSDTNIDTPGRDEG